MPAPVRSLPPDLAGVLVTGIAWYRDRHGEVRALPAQTVVPAAAVLAPLGADGRYALLALPGGDLAVDGRSLPYEPVTVDDVFPLGRADVPWTPEQRHGALDLSRDWRMLFRERDAFIPWAAPDAVAAAVWAAYGRAHGPRATFRTGPDRRQVRLIYPQLIPPHLCHRLGPGYLRLPDRRPYGPVCAEGTEIGLREAGGCTATIGTDALGWRTAVRGADGEPETARRPDEALRLLASRAAFWELPVSSTGARLLAPSGSLLRG